MYATSSLGKNQKYTLHIYFLQTDEKVNFQYFI